VSCPNAILPPSPKGMGLLWKDNPARSSRRFPELLPSFEDVDTLGPPNSPSKSMRLVGPFVEPLFVDFLLGVIGSELTLDSWREWYYIG
jgi:hypothetical protein